MISQGINFEDQDIESKKVEPSALDKYLVSLITWGVSGFNGGNSFKYSLEFLSWKCNLKTNILMNSIELELDLYN